jgi:hypothetical protein
MSNAVLVATNSANATENMKFRLEYQVEGGGKGNFDWQPTFGQTNAQLLADLLTTIQAVILARHGLTVLDSEVLVMGVPAVTTP